MKTVLAYIITVVVSQFCLTGGVLTGTFLGGILLWLPKRIGLSERIGIPFCSFLGGVAGSILSITVAFFVFKWLVGHDSFGWGPFLAATIPLSIPIYNDYRKSQELKRIQSEAPERVASFAAPMTLGSRTMVFGELTGIILGGILFL